MTPRSRTHHTPSLLVRHIPNPHRNYRSRTAPSAIAALSAIHESRCCEREKSPCPASVAFTGRLQRTPRQQKEVARFDGIVIIGARAFQNSSRHESKSSTLYDDQFTKARKHLMICRCPHAVFDDSLGETARC